MFMRERDNGAGVWRKSVLATPRLDRQIHLMSEQFSLRTRKEFMEHGEYVAAGSRGAPGFEPVAYR
jgi:hypothetical protein